MAVRGPSRQELIRQRRRSGFVGRLGELAAFKDALRQSPDQAQQFLFHVHGPAGVGKSTLVRQLENAAREADACTAYVDESAADVFEAMATVSAQLAQQGLAMKGFDRLLATYRQRRHEVVAGAGGADPTGEWTADARAGGRDSPRTPSPAGVVASQLGLAGLGMIPGVGALAGAVDPAQVAAGADRVKALLSARLRSHEDVQLVLSPLQVLAPLFLQELAEAARRRPWVVLFFDTYERTGPLLDTWLRNMLVTDRYGELPANVLVVLAGQRRLDAACWGDWLDLVTDLPLDVFTDAEARQFLSAKGITGERVVEVILELSGRLPVLVSTLAETRPHSALEVGDPSGTAVERFLKWEPDPARRAAALACAFPQHFDQDVYRAAVPDEETNALFTWLRSMPFVTDRAGQCHYHDVVRTAMLRLQRQQSPERWQEQHTRLADAFLLRRTRLEEATAPAGGWWDDERWRNHRLQETYHRLCANPRTALPHALREALDAYSRDATTLRRWVETLTRAGADAPAVQDWGQRLLDALEDEQPGVAALSVLLAGGGLDSAGRSLARTLRGRDHRTAAQYRQALDDYDAALALQPASSRALSGRGETYRAMGRSDEALADFTRALAIDPGDAEALAHRGETYRQMRQYDDALADLTRAVEIEPEHAWAIGGRGETYRAMGRNAEAIADFTRALRLDPDYAWTFANRARTYSSMQRYDESIADFTRAIAINPEYAWAIANRGDTYTGMGRHDEAIADFSRAIAINPDYTWAVTHRAIAYRRTGRYDEALADFTRIIDVHPESAWTLVGRGITYHFTGRYGEALADLSRAVEIDPTSTWAFVNRAIVYRRTGRYDEALADLDQAIEINPDSPRAHYEKAVVLHATGAADGDGHLARAVELIGLRSGGTPREQMADKGNLVLIHCAAARWDEADRFLTEFLGRGPARGEVSELLSAVNGLLDVFPAADGHLRPLRRQLEDALSRT